MAAATENTNQEIPAVRRADGESRTLAGSLVGTPAYMSPQLYAGQPADAKSDQFAFGVALYEALYRTRPFSKEDLVGKDARPKAPPELGVPAILMDNEGGAYTAVHHLLDRGHSRIAMLSGRASISTTTERVAGDEFAEQ